MHNDACMHSGTLTTSHIGAPEAADILGIDKSTLTRWAQAGKISAIKAPGLRGPYLFDLAEVHRVAAERAEADAPESQA